MRIHAANLAAMLDSSFLLGVAEQLEYDDAGDQKGYAERENNPNARELYDFRRENGRKGNY